MDILLPRYVHIQKLRPQRQTLRTSQGQASISPLSEPILETNQKRTPQLLPLCLCSGGWDSLHPLQHQKTRQSDLGFYSSASL